MTPPPSGDDALEMWLRANTDLPPLPDDGFTGQVLAALPPPARRRFPPRLVAAMVGAIAGTAVAAWPLFAAGHPREVLPALEAALLALLSHLASPAMGLAVITTLSSLCFVFRKDLRRVRPW
ncbi:MAG TPA: hypothetical protein VHN79_06615 [Lacunisphaera sp.]|nr:hypothetical protein [Lacunisphaera sp.]